MTLEKGIKKLDNVSLKALTNYKTLLSSLLEVYFTCINNHYTNTSYTEDKKQLLFNLIDTTYKSYYELTHTTLKELDEVFKIMYIYDKSKYQIIDQSTVHDIGNDLSNINVAYYHIKQAVRYEKSYDTLTTTISREIKNIIDQEQYIILHLQFYKEMFERALKEQK